MQPSDRDKTEFVTPDVLWECNVMSFGLCNAPATFELFMDTDLRELRREICMCYLDDVISDKAFQVHNERLSIVFECIKQAGLVLNSNKCYFGEQQALGLRCLIDKAGIRPDSEKLAAVRDFGQPRTPKDLRSFLRPASYFLASYFRRFIPTFAQLADHPTSLLYKDSQFMCAPECESSFNKLKFALCSAPILRHLDPSSATEIPTDANGIGVGAVLVQLQGSAEHIIVHAKRRLTKAENNYTLSELECLAVVLLCTTPDRTSTDATSTSWLTIILCAGSPDCAIPLDAWQVRLYASRNTTFLSPVRAVVSTVMRALCRVMSCKQQLPMRTTSRSV